MMSDASELRLRVKRTLLDSLVDVVVGKRAQFVESRLYGRGLGDRVATALRGHAVSVAPVSHRIPAGDSRGHDGVLYLQGVAMDSWSGVGPVPRRVFKTREAGVPVGWKVRLLRRSVARRAAIG
jgi:hypothetical protein